MMIPDVLQFLTCVGGRTSRIQLGTAVIVLLWHDPVRVAEQIAMLDILSSGRLVVGFGDVARRGLNTRVFAYRWRRLADALSRPPKLWSRRSSRSENELAKLRVGSAGEVIDAANWVA
jgi:alkanesulfonate monooxygenase SsuD/methylene tetrahydromethanopterin reductase-like flavin-dependent oxidoreductase (luciferase family)